MKTRIIKDRSVVWFGSYGKNEDGTGMFVNNDKSSYADKNEGVAQSLSQRLSVIKGELWYNVKVGIPLFDNLRSKGIIDSYVITTISKHPDVLSITEFSSNVINRTYHCDLKCSTIYGEIEVNL